MDRRKSWQSFLKKMNEPVSESGAGILGLVASWFVVSYFLQNGQMSPTDLTEFYTLLAAALAIGSMSLIVKAIFFSSKQEVSFDPKALEDLAKAMSLDHEKLGKAIAKAIHEEFEEERKRDRKT
jgi:hypothetical protein